MNPEILSEHVWGAMERALADGESIKMTQMGTEECRYTRRGSIIIKCNWINNRWKEVERRTISK